MEVLEGVVVGGMHQAVVVGIMEAMVLLIHLHHEEEEGVVVHMTSQV
jgi:hypothetical protein